MHPVAIILAWNPWLDGPVLAVASKADSSPSLPDAAVQLLLGSLRHCCTMLMQSFSFSTVSLLLNITIHQSSGGKKQNCLRFGAETQFNKDLDNLFFSLYCVLLINAVPSTIIIKAKQVKLFQPFSELTCSRNIFQNLIAYQEGLCSDDRVLSI